MTNALTPTHADGTCSDGLSGAAVAAHENVQTTAAEFALQVPPRVQLCVRRLEEAQQVAHQRRIEIRTFKVITHV